MMITTAVFSVLLLHAMPPGPMDAIPQSDDRADTWNYYTIDTGGISAPSLVLDDWNQPHLAYEKDGGIWYATREAGVWTWETGQVAASGESPCISLDPSQCPWIVYSAIDDELEIAFRGDSVWQKITYSDWEREMRNARMAIDGQEQIHLAYYTFDSNGYPYELRYAVGDGSEWDRSELAGYSEEGTVFPLTLTLSTEGIPRIAAIHRWNDPYDRDNYFLKVFVRDDTTENWFITTLATMSCRGTACVAAGNEDLVAVAYQWISETEGIRYHPHPGSPGLVYPLGQSPDLELDPAGIPHIAFRSGGSILYGWLDGEDWVLDCIPYASGVDGPELELDSAVQPHLAFAGGGSLMFAWHGDETGISGNEPTTGSVLIGSVSPVPADNSVTVMLLPGITGRVCVRLYDLSGRCAMGDETMQLDGAGSALVLDTSDLPPGVYGLVFRSGHLVEARLLTVSQ